MNIGSTIKRLRLSRKLTQEEFAETLGITVQTVSRWENGVNYPDVTILPSLAELFEVTTDYLLGVKKDTRTRKLIKTIEVFELDSLEEAQNLVEEFENAVFPKMISHNIDDTSGKTMLTVEKEFGVALNKMKFEE